jgi:hypothetical protein
MVQEQELIQTILQLVPLRTKMELVQVVQKPTEQVRTSQRDRQ